MTFKARSWDSGRSLKIVWFGIGFPSFMRLVLLNRNICYLCRYADTACEQQLCQALFLFLHTACNKFPPLKSPAGCFLLHEVSALFLRFHVFLCSANRFFFLASFYSWYLSICHTHFENCGYHPSAQSDCQVSHESRRSVQTRSPSVKKILCGQRMPHQYQIIQHRYSRPVVSDLFR